MGALKCYMSLTVSACFFISFWDSVPLVLGLGLYLLYVI